MAATVIHLTNRNMNYREKFRAGEKGAEIERKQILEDQCRTVSETLFKKRRDLQKWQSTFDGASRELMEAKAEKNDIERAYAETQQMLQAVGADVGQIGGKMDRFIQSKDSKLNNVRAVKGQDFDRSGANLAILAEVESTKSQYLLNAVS